jgi:hypothetical protein
MAKPSNKGQTTSATRSSRGTKSSPPAKPAQEVEVDTDGAADGANAKARSNGPRGSAPWATRHAAKRAAEAAARNATPPPPGSARATLRTPERAEELKAQLTELSNATLRLKALKRTLHKDFWEAAVLLADIQERQLFHAKGYSSFENFTDREIDLGKATAVRLAKLPKIFQPAAAKEIGMAGILNALDAIDGERESQTRITVAQPAKPLKPPMAARG